jgi:protocatechuate 3,4-dioxygenase beta subunit
MNAYRKLTLVLLAVLLVGGVFASSATAAGPGRGNPQRCQDPNGSISGVVSDANGPVAGAHVTAGRALAFGRPGPHGLGDAEASLSLDGDELDAGRGGGGKSAETDENGAYTIDGLCAGNYLVSAGKRDVGVGSYDSDNDGKPNPVELTADAPAATAINITLAIPQRPTPVPACENGQGTISGAVTDKDGNAVEGATVRAGGRGSKAEATTDASGNYTLTGLCNGSYHVSAHKADVGGGHYDADANGRPDTVELADGANTATGINISLKLMQCEPGPRRP